MAVDDSYTKLLLHMDGADNGTTFTDEAGKTVTRYNAVTKTGVKKFGSASGYFDGNSYYLTVPDSDDWAFLTDNFTIDVWVYRTNYYDDRFIVGRYRNGSNRWRLTSNIGDGKINFLVNYGGKSVGNYKSTAAIPLNTWAHVALVRNGTSNGCIKIYLDGVDVTPASPAVNLGNTSMQNITGTLFVGQHGGGNFYWAGYMDELRISKGIARWTSNFTPPTAAYGPSAPVSTGIMFATFI